MSGDSSFAPAIPRKRKLAAAHFVTGMERRRINPNRGTIKVAERNLDRLVSRYIYPHLARVWNPYSWLLERRFTLAETSIAPQGWPADVDPLRVLLITDIHAGIFLRPDTLAKLIRALINLRPDLVAVGGDLVTGHVDDVKSILGALAPLTAAPLGAWYCFGNHDYFGGAIEDT